MTVLENENRKNYNVPKNRRPHGDSTLLSNVRRIKKKMAWTSVRARDCVCFCLTCNECEAWQVKCAASVHSYYRTKVKFMIALCSAFDLLFALRILVLWSVTYPATARTKKKLEVTTYKEFYSGSGSGSVSRFVTSCMDNILSEINFQICAWVNV